VSNHHDKDTLRSTGKYFLSSYRDILFGKIDPNAERFPKIKPSPGPYEYSMSDARDHELYLLSGYRSKGARRFDKESKFTHNYWKTSDTPGPGQYESSNITKKRKNQSAIKH